MKKKIIRKKHNVKKKRIKSLPKSRKIGRATSRLQKKAWDKKMERGDIFESWPMREPRPPVTFNFIKTPLSALKIKAGDPFSAVGNGHLEDALRYMNMPGLQSQASTATMPMTRGELGKAPSHYSHGKYTPWEIVDDWNLEYYTGNAMKYVCRHKHKGTPVQDIQKAIDCLIKYKTILEKDSK